MDSRKIVRPGMNKPKGFSYFKTLIAAAVTFVMLVILVPLMTNHRAKVSTDKPESDKNKVVAEIPRSDAPGDSTASSWSPAAPRDELPADSSVLRGQAAPQGQNSPESTEKKPEVQAPAPPPPAVAAATPGSHAAAQKNGASSPTAHGAAPATPSSHSGKGQSSMSAPIPTSGAAKAGQQAGTTGSPPAQTTASVQKPKEQKPKEQKPKEQKTAAASPSVGDAQKNGGDAKTARKSAKEASIAPAPSDVKAKTPSETTPAPPANKETKLSSVEAPKVEKPKSGVQYVIQVGAFQKMENAQAIQESYKKKGYSVQIRSHYDLNKGQLYLVQLEPIGDAGKANATMSRIRQEGASPIMLKVGVGQ